MENYYYTCMYDVIQSNTPDERKSLMLRQYKARIVRLHLQRCNRAVLDTATNDKIEGEEPSLFHLIRISGRRSMREIRHIRESSGRIVTTQEEIANTLVDYFQRKYQPIAIDVASMGALIDAIPPVEPGTYAEHLERPFSAEELHEAIKMGSRKQTPGIDGISLEYYLENWDLIWHDLLELFNHMFLTNSTTPNQNRGIIVCIKKDGEDKTPDGYRPITLLTNEYKILARILAGRLKQIVQDNITSN
jgi:hypothetical protein